MSNNVNIGIIGHVDSGKTSLARGISSVASTAAFDKSPQSKERGITLDLGFSSFDLTPNITATLVDCPGHASLIRTIIGGAQIVDLAILVIDAIKGIQTQTAECLVIAEITMNSPDGLIVALNKIDLIPEKERAEKIEKIIKGLKKTLSLTKFKNAPIVPIAASIGAADLTVAEVPSMGLDLLMQTIKSQVQTMGFKNQGPFLQKDFLFAIDHCFGIKGQGTVFTGTVLAGKVEIGDVILFSYYASFIIKLNCNPRQ